MSASLRKERRSALVWSYVFLTLFAVVFILRDINRRGTEA